MTSDALAPYAAVIIKLLQNVLYHDDTAHWDLLLTHLSAVKAYFGKIGIEVYLDEAEGYAYLRQPEPDNDEQMRKPLPRLTRRDKLSYHVTLLCVLLRERLLQFDASGSESDQLVLSHEQLRDLLRPFFKEYSDETRQLRPIDATIVRVVELGFLRRFQRAEEEQYEVRRVLKAKIDSEKLIEIKQKLQSNAQLDD